MRSSSGPFGPIFFGVWQSAQSPAFTATLAHLKALGMTSQQAVAAVTAQVTNQAYLLATDDLFRIFAILMVLLIPAIWFTGRAVTGGGHAAGGD